MKLRQIGWDDVRISDKFWVNRKGERRVSASLRGCSFVHHLFWIKDYDPENKTTQAAIMLVLRRKLHETVKKLDRYTED